MNPQFHYTGKTHNIQPARPLFFVSTKNIAAISPLKNAGGEGFEPPAQDSQVVKGRKVVKDRKEPSPALSPGQTDNEGEDVAEVVLAWSSLSTKVRAAILALAKTAKGGQS